jgi:hypothetical protein
MSSDIGREFRKCREAHPNGGEPAYRACLEIYGPQALAQAPLYRKARAFAERAAALGTPTIGPGGSDWHGAIWPAIVAGQVLNPAHVRRYMKPPISEAGAPHLRELAVFWAYRPLRGPLQGIPIGTGPGWVLDTAWCATIIRQLPGGEAPGAIIYGPYESLIPYASL